MTIDKYDLVHDPDTGFYHSAQGELKFMSNRIPIITFDASGLVTEDDDALLNFTGRTVADGKNVIRGASLDFEDVTGWIVFSGNTELDAYRYSAYFQPQSAGSAKLLGIGNTGILQSGWSGNTAEAAV
jgi:hypothetical protein